MQLSVLPHLTIYGDVKESDLRKKPLTERLGLSSPNPKSLGSGSNAATEGEVKIGRLEAPEEKAVRVVDMKSEVTRPAAPRADLMKSSGQVGKLHHNTRI